MPLAEAARRAPEKTSVREALGRAYFRNRQFAEAAAEFEAVVETPPGQRLRPLLPRPRAEQDRRAATAPATTWRWPRTCAPSAATTASTATACARRPSRRVRALVQRVSRAAVSRRRRARSPRSAPGCWCCSACAAGDGEAEADRLADKVRALRVFDDADGRMNEPLGEREVLCVSQFTLLRRHAQGQPAELRRRGAARELAEPLYERFCERLGAKRGAFGARMAVELVNDGPVTLMLEPERALHAGLRDARGAGYTRPPSPYPNPVRGGPGPTFFFAFRGGSGDERIERRVTSLTSSGDDRERLAAARARGRGDRARAPGRRVAAALHRPSPTASISRCASASPAAARPARALLARGLLARRRPAADQARALPPLSRPPGQRAHERGDRGPAQLHRDAHRGRRRGRLRRRRRPRRPHPARGHPPLEPVPDGGGSA